MKRLCCMLAAAWLLWTVPGGTVCAAETTAQTTKAVSAEEDGGSSAGAIAGIIAIFTVTCGVTAYLVMRPSLKKLKDAKNAAKWTEQQAPDEDTQP